MNDKHLLVGSIIYDIHIYIDTYNCWIDYNYIIIFVSNVDNKCFGCLKKNTVHFSTTLAPPSLSLSLLLFQIIKNPSRIRCAWSYIEFYGKKLIRIVKPNRRVETVRGRRSPRDCVRAIGERRSMERRGDERERQNSRWSIARDSVAAEARRLPMTAESAVVCARARQRVTSHPSGGYESGLWADGW